MTRHICITEYDKETGKFILPSTAHLEKQIGSVHRKWSQLGRDRNAEAWAEAYECDDPLSKSWDCECCPKAGGS